jgi:preprotein translocase subunit SecF
LASLIVVFILLLSCLPNALQLGVCAIGAMIHDIAIVFSLLALEGISSIGK